MRKIKEALRLKAAGPGNREAAASIGAGKTTVYELLARAEGAGAICSTAGITASGSAAKTS
jgi:transposase